MAFDANALRDLRHRFLGTGPWPSEECLVRGDKAISPARLRSTMDRGWLTPAQREALGEYVGRVLCFAQEPPRDIVATTPRNPWPRSPLLPENAGPIWALVMVKWASPGTTEVLPDLVLLERDDTIGRGVGGSITRKVGGSIIRPVNPETTRALADLRGLFTMHVGPSEGGFGPGAGDVRARPGAIGGTPVARVGEAFPVRFDLLYKESRHSGREAQEELEDSTSDEQLVGRIVFPIRRDALLCTHAMILHADPTLDLPLSFSVVLGLWAPDGQDELVSEMAREIADQFYRGTVPLGRTMALTMMQPLVMEHLLTDHVAAGLSGIQTANGSDSRLSELGTVLARAFDRTDRALPHLQRAIPVYHWMLLEETAGLQRSARQCVPVKPVEGSRLLVDPGASAIQWTEAVAAWCGTEAYSALLAAAMDAGRAQSGRAGQFLLLNVDPGRAAIPGEVDDLLGRYLQQNDAGAHRRWNAAPICMPALRRLLFSPAEEFHGITPATMLICSGLQEEWRGLLKLRTEADAPNEGYRRRVVDALHAFFSDLDEMIQKLQEMDPDAYVRAIFGSQGMFDAWVTTFQVKETDRLDIQHSTLAWARGLAIYGFWCDILCMGQNPGASGSSEWRAALWMSVDGDAVSDGNPGMGVNIGFPWWPSVQLLHAWDGVSRVLLGDYARARVVRMTAADSTAEARKFDASSLAHALRTPIMAAAGHLAEATRSTQQSVRTSEIVAVAAEKLADVELLSHAQASLDANRMVAAKVATSVNALTELRCLTEALKFFKDAAEDRESGIAPARYRLSEVTGQITKDHQPYLITEQNIRKWFEEACSYVLSQDPDSYQDRIERFQTKPGALTVDAVDIGPLVLQVYWPAAAEWGDPGRDALPMPRFLLQEALLNAVKYACDETIQVTIKRSENLYTLVVSNPADQTRGAAKPRSVTGTDETRWTLIGECCWLLGWRLPTWDEMREGKITINAGPGET